MSGDSGHRVNLQLRLASCVCGPRTVGSHAQVRAGSGAGVGFAISGRATELRLWIQN